MVNRGYKQRQTEWLKSDSSLTSWTYTDSEEEGMVFSQYHEALEVIYLVVVPVAHSISARSKS